MVLVIGYGNPARSDDGIGIHLAERIAKEDQKDVCVKTIQQLGPEFLDEMIRSERVILIDALARGPEVSFRKVDRGASTLVSSHHVNPRLFVDLALRLHQIPLNLFVCTVRGEHFGFGTSLSPQVIARGEKALKRIRAALSSKGRPEQAERVEPHA